MQSYRSLAPATLVEFGGHACAPAQSQKNPGGQREPEAFKPALVGLQSAPDLAVVPTVPVCGGHRTARPPAGQKESGGHLLHFWLPMANVPARQVQFAAWVLPAGASVPTAHGTGAREIPSQKVSSGHCVQFDCSRVDPGSQMHCSSDVAAGVKVRLPDEQLR
eukprot:1847247-Rhodomonas_salina.1